MRHARGGGASQTAHRLRGIEGALRRRALCARRSGVRTHVDVKCNGLRNLPRLRLDIVLNNLAPGVIRRGRIRLLSDGTAWRRLIHIRDVAKVTLAILEAPEDQVRGEAINVGANAQNYQIRELADLLSRRPAASSKWPRAPCPTSARTGSTSRN